MKSIALITSLNFADQIAQISGSGIRHRMTMEAIKEGGYELRVIVLDATNQAFTDNDVLSNAIKAAWGLSVKATIIRFAKPALARLNYLFLPILSQRFEREYLAAKDSQVLEQLHRSVQGADAVFVVKDFPCLAFQNARRRFSDLRMPLIFDTEDISHVRFERMARDGSLYGPRTLLLLQRGSRRRLDRQLVTGADVTLVCSDHDKSTLTALTPKAHLQTAVNVGTPPEQTLKSKDAYALVFVGSLSYPPNVQACKTLVYEVMPLVWKKIPRATLHLVGGGLTVELRSKFSKDQRIVIHGYVASTDEAFALGSVFVCPLSSGGGTRLKLIDAGLRNLPIVATKLAAEGLMLTHDLDYLEAETAIGIAQHCLKLLESQPTRERLVLANKAHMQKYFSPEAAKTELVKILSRALT